MSTSIAATIESDSAEQAQSAKPALLALMSSEGAQILSHALVAEPYSSGTMRSGASKAFFYSETRVSRAVAACPSGTVTPRRDHQTLAHGYKRPSASLGDQVGGLSTALALFASPPLILSTESVVVMECKGMR